MTEALTYRLDLQYVGTGFEGWQSQPAGTGVQDHVEKALATLLRHPVRVIAASRTDSGVHAEHQVAIFRTPVPFDERRWLKSLTGLLPDSVGVNSVAPAPADFHPVRGAKAKAYRYRIWLGPTRNPLIAPFCWSLFTGLDAAALAAEAQYLVGTHDFTSFCAADSSAKTRIRTIVEASVRQEGHLVEIWIVGHGFLKQMVRILVGTLVDVALGKRPAGTLSEVLAAKDRTVASRTAPAQGLALVEIFYGDIPAVAALRERLAGGFSVRLA